MTFRVLISDTKLSLRIRGHKGVCVFVLWFSRMERGLEWAPVWLLFDENFHTSDR